MTNDPNPKKSSVDAHDPDDGKAYKLMLYMAVLIISILGFGIFLAFYLKNFAFVPFSVVVMGIIAFFGVLRINRALPGSNENEMRKSITVSILVVYLGLLPTLAFQGILQFQLTGNTSSEVAVLNQTANQTIVQVIPQTVALSETVVTSFTALVAAVLLFYFGSRTANSYYDFLKAKEETKTTEATEDDTETVDSTETEKEVTVVKYDSEGKCVEKTVTTERIKKIE